MMAMLGNQPGYEEAARALYAGDRQRFLSSSDGWPVDLRGHARSLAEAAFERPASERTEEPLREVLSAQLDIAWALAAHHLEGLTTAECLWRPSPRCLHVARDAGGAWRADWPEHEGYDIGPPSIAWTTWHIGFWWTKALRHLEGDPSLTKEDVVWPGSADAVRSELRGLHDRWRERLGMFTEAQLHLRDAASWPLPTSTPAMTAAWLNVELMKNAAEIGMVRFLHATRAAS